MFYLLKGGYTPKAPQEVEMGALAHAAKQLLRLHVPTKAWSLSLRDHSSGPCVSQDSFPPPNISTPTPLLLDITDFIYVYIYIDIYMYIYIYIYTTMGICNIWGQGVLIFGGGECKTASVPCTTAGTLSIFPGQAKYLCHSMQLSNP